MSHMNVRTPSEHTFDGGGYAMEMALCTLWRFNLRCYTCERVMSHMNASCSSCERVMSHMNVLTPSEHTFDGVEYAVEIQFEVPYI